MKVGVLALDKGASTLETVVLVLARSREDTTGFTRVHLGMPRGQRGWTRVSLVCAPCQPRRAALECALVPWGG